MKRLVLVVKHYQHIFDCTITQWKVTIYEKLLFNVAQILFVVCKLMSFKDQNYTGTYKHLTL